MTALPLERKRSQSQMNSSAASDGQALYKQQAAEAAVQFVRSGMTVGLGTGSTAIFATRRIGELLRAGALRDITAIATSARTDEEARKLGIRMMEDALPRSVDLTIDGADEIDPDFNVIKGGGGALLREKIVAQASARMFIVADQSKLSDCLGTRFAVPVEVLQFGWKSQQNFLEQQGAKVSQRKAENGKAYLTDSNNYILDCNFGPIADSPALALSLASRAGIIEHGLFIGLATDVVVAGEGGVRHLERKR
jgi:ribose 5-phosphate isomerase A